MSDQVKFYGMVSDSLLKKALFKGTLLGLAGLCIMPFSFIGGALFVAWGFFPYRNLKSLSPTLIVTEKYLISQDQSIPIHQIRQLSYEEHTILVKLSNDMSVPIPHFSRRTFEELKLLIESDHAF